MPHPATTQPRRGADDIRGMKTVIRRGVGVIAAVAAVLAVVGVRAARAETKEELDTRLRGELERAAPDAVPAWDAANAELERTDFEAAVADFRKVTELAPQFDAAFRRMAGPLGALGRYDDAKAASQHALDLASSPLNRAALAEILMRGGPGDLQRARDLSHQAASEAPDDAYVVGVQCETLLASGVDDGLESCVARALELGPEDPHANVLAALVADARGNADEALARLEKGRAALTQEGYLEIRTKIEADRPQPSQLARIAWIALYVLGGWAAGLLAIFVIGWILSFVTLRAIERAAAAGGAGGGGQRGLRRVYRAVIAIASAYFYLSIPIVLCGVLAAGVGVIGGILASGYIAPKLFLLIVVLVGATFVAVLRGLFARPLRDAPGERLDLSREPALREALDEVANVVGTRPVDAVYLVPGCDVAVSEHRAGRGRRPERRLILGVGVLDGMKKGWLKSILAHEHGHFRNEDTAGGTVALAVRRSLILITVRLARSGAATRFNPAWLFVRLYLGLFLRVSQGASRLQEVLADRWAARAYGSAAFEAGFRHVVERDVTFELRAGHVLRDVIDHKRPLANLYHHEPAKPFTGEAVEDAIVRAMDRPPAPYDSHPAPRQRLAWVAALAAPPRANPDDDEPAWSLFADRAAIELRMTEVVRDNVARNHGVSIAKPA
jgi:Zn-dependent protease with chaperone function